MHLIFILKILKSTAVPFLPFLHYISGFSRFSYQPFNETIDLEEVQGNREQIKMTPQRAIGTIQIGGMILILHQIFCKEKTQRDREREKEIELVLG